MFIMCIYRYHGSWNNDCKRSSNQQLNALNNFYLRLMLQNKKRKGTVINPPPIPNKPAKKPTGKAVAIIKII